MKTKDSACLNDSSRVVKLSLHTHNPPNKEYESNIRHKYRDMNIEMLKHLDDIFDQQPNKL